MYSLLNVLWHLCEILFIETLPVGCLIQQLLEWVRESEREREDKEELTKRGEGIESRERGGEGGREKERKKERENDRVKIGSWNEYI